MPNYDYECEDCGYVFEEFQSMMEDPLSVCPKCGGKLRRLIGAGAGLIFKGSGFYITDYKKNSSVPSKTEQPAEKKDPEKADQGKTKPPPKKE